MVNAYPTASYPVTGLTFSKSPRIAIIEARYYTDLADMLLAGTVSTLNSINLSYDVITVAGSLELPMALQIAAQSKLYDGAVLLGAVIRGETTHYETVCQDSNRGVMDVSLKYNLPIGNAILTVENMDQAIERADPTKMNKGGGATEAMIHMIALQHKYGTK